MALLPVNTQSGVDAALSLANTGLTTRQSANVEADTAFKKQNIREQMAQFDEWQSADAKRARATQRKLEADFLTFQDENQDLITSGWATKQTATIAKNLSEWADSESDILATVTSPLMEAKTFEEAQDIYRTAVHPKLVEALPNRVGAFSSPDMFTEESWNKAKLTNLSAVRNRAQRQQLDLQNNEAFQAGQLQKEKHDQNMQLAKWDTYSKLLLQDNEFEFKLRMAGAEGKPATLDALGFSEDKMTHYQNSMVPRVVEEITNMFPDMDEEDSLRYGKAVTSDVVQQVRLAWDTLALSGVNPAEAFGSPAQLTTRFLAERMNPNSDYWVQDSTGLMGEKTVYSPTISAAGRRAARDRVEAEKKKTAAAKAEDTKKEVLTPAQQRSKRVEDVISKAKGTPEFDALTPKEQKQFAESVIDGVSNTAGRSKRSSYGLEGALEDAGSTISNMGRAYSEFSGRFVDSLGRSGMAASSPQ